MDGQPVYNYHYEQPQRDMYLSQLVQEIKRHHLSWRDSLTLLVALRGELEITVHGDVTVMREDDVVLINPNCEYSTMARHKNCLALVTVFDPMVFRRRLENFDALIFDCRTADDTRGDDRFVRLRGLVSYLLRSGLAGDEIGVEGSFGLFASELLRDFPPDVFTDNAGEGRLYTFDNILEYIRNNYRSNITLQDVSQVGNYNPAYISHLFKSKVRVGFHDCLTRLRLRSAVADLNHTDKSMAQIALDNGFPNTKAFYKSFREMYHQTPFQYKKQILTGDFSDLRFPDAERQRMHDESIEHGVPMPDSFVEEKLRQYLRGARLE